MSVIPDKTKEGRILVYYIASPYSTPVDIGDFKSKRCDEVEAIAVDLMKKGYVLIEPIASSHHKAIKHKLPQTFDYWKKRDLALIDACDGLIVAADMENWDRSAGVTEELIHAKRTNKPIFLYKNGEFEVLHG